MIFFPSFSAKIFGQQSGQLLVELLMTVGLFAVISPALLTGFVASTQGKAQQAQRILAVALLRESEEAVRSVREKGWTGFAQNGNFHPVENSGTWDLTPGSEEVGDLTREVVISDVQRDGNGQIVSSGGNVDPSTKKVDIVVSWTQPQSSSVSSTTYLTRYLDNLTFTETTEAEFSAGTLTDVAVTNTNGGEVVLGSGGFGDWCRPSDYIVGNLDLPNSGDARDVKALEGKAFTGTHSGGSGSFVEINISNDQPPIPTTANTILGYETNDVFIDDNYAYVATGDISKDVVIIDLNTNQEVGYFNDSYPFGSAQGIYVVGNVGYTTIGFRLHTFDLSSKSGSRPELDSTSLGFLALGYRLHVVGNYAYVAISLGSSELRLVNVSNPSNISLAGYANVNGSIGQEVYVNDTGTRAYLATSSSSSKDEVFIIDTTNKNGSMPVLGSYNTNDMNPKGITVVPGNRAIIVGTSGEEYQVLDTTYENNPVRCGGTDINTGIYGVSSVLEADGDAYSYIVTGDNTDEFKIILGGPGGSGGSYLPSGTFESQYFDSNFTTAFNRFSVNYVQPIETTITFQVAVAAAVSGSCESAVYNFVGPDGTSSTYFSIDGPIPFTVSGSYQNPGRCLKYRAFLSTNDSAFTPVLEDVTVNYSP